METETDDNLEPVSVGQAVHWKGLYGISTAAFTSGEFEYIYRGPDMFYMLSSEENQGVFVTQLFQQSDDVPTAAMLKQIGDDVKRKQDQGLWDLSQVI